MGFDYRTYTGLGNRLLEGTNKTLCTPGPRRKEQWPHKRLTQTCPWVSRSVQQRRGSAVACCRVRGTECSSACMGPFEGGRLYLNQLHHSLVSDQTTGREHSPAHQQKIGLKIYWVEKEMATYSSVLAWRIPGTGEPGGLPSMGSHRVRHDWSDLAAAAAADTINRNCFKLMHRNFSMKLQMLVNESWNFTLLIKHDILELKWIICEFWVCKWSHRK